MLAEFAFGAFVQPNEPAWRHYRREARSRRRRLDAGEVAVLRARARRVAAQGDYARAHALERRADYIEAQQDVDLGLLWVRVRNRETFGPYANSRWNQILDFARIGSRFGGPREVWDGTKKPQRLHRVYAGGKRTYPAEVLDVQRQRERMRFTGTATFRRKARAGRRRAA